MASEIGVDCFSNATFCFAESVDYAYQRKVKISILLTDGCLPDNVPSILIELLCTGIFGGLLLIHKFSRSLTRQHVQVVGVTLQVPNYEFLVLLSAANRGAHWQDGASTTAFLLQNVEVFEPKVYNRSQLLMSRYTGWSVNGHDIMFVPMSPLAESDKLLDQDFLSLLENSNKGNEDSVALGVGIGVGVGVGTLLLIASSCLLAIVLRRKRVPVSVSIQEMALQQGRYQHPNCYPGAVASTSSKRQQASAGTGSPSCTKNATKSRALSTKEGLPADIAPVQEVEVDEDSMPIQRIVADQGDLFNPSYFNMLLRQEVSSATELMEVQPTLCPARAKLGKMGICGLTVTAQCGSITALAQHMPGPCHSSQSQLNHRLIPNNTSIPVTAQRGTTCSPGTA
eukprot:1159942-Pelagomonas_calceolata.AAC.3